MGRRAAKVGFLVHELYVPVISILDRAFPSPRRAPRLKARLAIGFRTQNDFDVLGNAENSFLDPVADQLSFSIVNRFGSLPEGRLFVQLVLLAPNQSQGMMNPPVLRDVDRAPYHLIPAVLMDRIRRHGENIVGFKMESLAVVPFPTLTGHAEQRGSGNMPVRSADRSVGRDMRKMTGHAVERTAGQHVIGDMVAGLMRASHAHNRRLHGQLLEHMRQRIGFRVLLLLVNEPLHLIRYVIDLSPRLEHRLHSSYWFAFSFMAGAL